MNYTNFSFESDAIKVLNLSNRIRSRSNMECNTDVSCFVAILSLDCSPIFKRMKTSNNTDEQIRNAAYKVLNKFLVKCAYQHTVFTLYLKKLNMYFPLSDDLYTVLKRANEIAINNYNKNSIGINELFAAFTEYMTDEYEDFLNSCNSYPKPNNKLKLDENDSISIPTNLAGCLHILNLDFSTDEEYCKILGRETEALELVRILSKCTKKNAVLVGPPGVGKTAIIEKLTWMIVTGNCPSRFKKSIIVSLDINSIIAGTIYRGSAEARFEELIKFLTKYTNCILFIDEIHNLLGAGACRDGDLDLANALKPILARGTTQVIGATTSEEYDKYFSKDGALKRRFEKILVNEPKSYEVYSMIENQIKKLTEFHSVSISKDLISNVIFYASCFNKETRNPDRTLDLLDKVLASASLNEKNDVSKEDILDVFNSNYKKFDKTPYSTKVSLAYHEAGHYIVHRFSTLLYNTKTIALSIMPADSYLGAHVYEIDDEILSLKSLDYFIQLIGCKLAGRIAEEMYSKTLSSGACSDLENATKLAMDVVTKYGLIESFSTNRSYSVDDKFMDSKVTSSANIEVDYILEKARMYAKYTLKHNYDSLKKVVNALLSRYMLSGNELDELLNDKIIPTHYIV